MSDKILRAALIGVGNMGKKYVQMIVSGEVSNIKLTAVVIRRDELMEWGETLVNTDGEYETLDEYKAKAKDSSKVFYVNDKQQQAQYIKLFKDNGVEAVVLDTRLDVPYVGFLEANCGGTKFARIDSKWPCNCKAC